MRDEQIHELISAYADGETTPQERAIVERLLQDQRHQAYLDQVRQLSDQIRRSCQWAAQQPPPVDFAPQVLSQLPTAPWANHLKPAAIHQPAAIDEPAAAPTPIALKPADLSPAGGGDAAATGGWSLSGWMTVLAVAAVLTLVVYAVRVRYSGDPERPETPIAKSDPKPGPRQPDSVGPDEPIPGGAYVSVMPNLFMAYEVVLTPQGVQNSSFVAALAEAGIDFEASIPLDSKLQDELLKNRFLGLPETPADAPSSENQPAAAEPMRKSLDLIYVISGGRQFDRVHHFLLDERRDGSVGSVGMDVAMLPNDMDFFQHLHEAADLQIAQAGRRPQGLQVRAQRLAMELALQGRLGRGIRSLSTPATALMQSLLNMQAVEPGRRLLNPPRRDPAVDEQHRKMEAMTFGVLFIVRSPQSPPQGA